MKGNTPLVGSIDKKRKCDVYLQISNEDNFNELIRILTEEKLNFKVNYDYNSVLIDAEKV
jgi:hypothetical protein